MNQSNKALRDLAKKFVNYRVLADMAYSEVKDGVYTQKEYEDALKRLGDSHAQQAIALVTNHIKDKMPEKNSEEIPPVAGLVPEPMVMANGWAREYQRGYNKALDEVQQIIKEVEEL